MNLRLKILHFWIPSSVKKEKLKQLFRLTADAFGCEAEFQDNFSYLKLLKSYAVFVQDQNTRARKELRDISSIRQKLYQNAYKIGLEFRKSLNIHGVREVMEFSRIFYGLLGINFFGQKSGEFVIDKCFFADHFSLETCNLISSLDEGIAAGLSDGKLEFSQRKTEGRDRCRGWLIMGGTKR